MGGGVLQHLPSFPMQPGSVFASHAAWLPSVEGPRQPRTLPTPLSENDPDSLAFPILSLFFRDPALTPILSGLHWSNGRRGGGVVTALTTGRTI